MRATTALLACLTYDAQNLGKCRPLFSSNADAVIGDAVPFPDAQRGVVPADKLLQYLLNPAHPIGGPKAAWFASLGYTSENATELANALLEVAHAAANFVSKPSPFGVKYEVFGEIGCSGFRPGKVTTVWMVAQNDPPRLVTAYPTR
jgi:hypothetical protein